MNSLFTASKMMERNSFQQAENHSTHAMHCVRETTCHFKIQQWFL